MTTRQKSAEGKDSISQMQQPLAPDTLNPIEKFRVLLNTYIFDPIGKKEIDRVSKTLKPAFEDATPEELAQIARAKIRYGKLSVPQLRTLYEAWKKVRDDPIFRGAGNDRLEFEAYNKFRGQNEGFVFNLACNATEWANDARYDVVIGERGVMGFFSLPKTDYTLNNQIQGGSGGPRYETGSRAQASWMKTIAHGFLDPDYGHGSQMVAVGEQAPGEAEFKKRIEILNVLKEY